MVAGRPGRRRNANDAKKHGSWTKTSDAQITTAGRIGRPARTRPGIHTTALVHYARHGGRGDLRFSGYGMGAYESHREGRIAGRQDEGLSIHSIGIKNPSQSCLTPAEYPKCIPVCVRSLPNFCQRSINFPEQHLDQGQLGGGNVQGVNVRSQAGVGLLGAVGAGVGC